MSATWELWLSDTRGRRMCSLDMALSFHLVRTINGEPGEFSLSLPGSFDDSLLQADYLVEFWRKPADGWSLLWFVGMIQDINLVESNGSDVTVIGGPDGKELLFTRIVAYDTGTSQARKTDYLDDMMKDVVRENLGSSAGSGRNLTSYNFTVEVDMAKAPSKTVTFAWQDLDKVLKKLADISRQAGTELFYDVCPTVKSDGSLGFEFKTYTGQPGIDRTGSSSPIYVGKEYGNLAGPKLSYSWRGEVNYVFAGGQGDEDIRQVQESGDTVRSGISPWHRREAFVDARNEDDPLAVKAAADAALAAGTPVTEFSGTLIDSEQARYGKDWDLGDRLIGEYRGRQVSALVRSVEITVERELETIVAQLAATYGRPRESSVIEGVISEIELVKEALAKTNRLESGASLGEVVSQFLSLPKLRGFWPFSSADQSNNVMDISGHGRTLTNTGTATLGKLTTGVPYGNCNGTSMYFQRLDEAGLDLTASMTLGGWFYVKTLPTGTNAKSLINKRGTNLAYSMQVRSLASPAGVWSRMFVSVDGAAVVEVVGTTSLAINTWYFIVGRYTPSTELAVFTNGVKVTNTTSIPASVYNNADPFQVNGYNGTNEIYDGYATLCFVCAEALDDSLLTRLFKLSRAFFAV